jgi:glucose-6-phosphate dehydrogenase assembly protein OpcA
MRPDLNPFNVGRLPGSPPAMARLTHLAERIGWHPDTVERQAAEGRLDLEVVRVGPARIRYVRTADAMRVLEQLGVPTP